MMYSVRVYPGDTAMDNKTLQVPAIMELTFLWGSDNNLLHVQYNAQWYGKKIRA